MFSFKGLSQRGNFIGSCISEFIIEILLTHISWILFGNNIMKVLQKYMLLSYLLMPPPEAGYWVGWTPGLTQNFHLFLGAFSTVGL